MIGKKHSEETKKKISLAGMGNTRGFKKGQVSPKKGTGKTAKERTHNYYLERRKIIDEIKSVPCMDCGNNFPPECMDFDHRKDKKFGIHNIMKNMTDLLKEIDKCDIVCANCHRVRTRKSDLLRKRKQL